MRRIPVLVVLLTLLAGAAAAADLPINAFYGRYSGGGVAETPQSLYFDVTARDFDVHITPEGNGFRVAWTTILVKGGDSDSGATVRRSTEIVFTPTAQPNLFVEAGPGAAAGGAPYSWARIEENTLTTYTFVIDDRGVYSLSSYARTVTPGGMELEFTSIRDGQPVRSVKGRLVKDAN